MLVLTADNSRKSKQEALSLGAQGFHHQTASGRAETLLRIYNLLETRWLHAQLHAQNETLEEKVRERTQQLEEAQLEILERLALAAEYRDDCTGRHTRRVGELAALLSTRIGLPAEHVELIHRAAPLHDIGKIGIPDGILVKAEQTDSSKNTSTSRRIPTSAWIILIRKQVPDFANRGTHRAVSP